MRWFALVSVVVVALAGVAAAKSARKSETKASKPKPQKISPAAKQCFAALDKLGVSYQKVGPHKGIDIPVEITGPLGGVTYKTWKKRDLVLDCSLVYSLAKAGAYFTDAGYSSAFYSSSYQQRNVKGTNRPSNHSYGLALDVHSWTGKEKTELAVKDHFELGLGDETDCIGAPVTEEGKEIKTIWCRMDRSGMFRFILNPDTDSEHWNHFHIEALPWKDRTDVGKRVSKKAE